MTADVRYDGPQGAPLFLFAHGAGAGMDAPFMETITSLLVARGIRVGRFEFPYMIARREGRKAGAPDRQPVLEAAWRDVIAAAAGQ
ncbi:MAG: alpha/beta family hydrolase, partial [Thermoanaerobaculia bacterium]